MIIHCIVIDSSGLLLIAKGAKKKELFQPKIHYFQ